MSDKPRQLRKALKRLASRIKAYEQMKSNHEGEFHKPGSNKK